MKTFGESIKKYLNWILLFISGIITIVIYLLIKNKTGMISFAVTNPTPYANQFNKITNLHNKFVCSNGNIVPAKTSAKKKCNIVTCKNGEEVITKVKNKTAMLGSINKSEVVLPDSVCIIDCDKKFKVHYNNIINHSVSMSYLDDSLISSTDDSSTDASVSINNLNNAFVSPKGDVIHKIGYNVADKDIVESIKNTHKDKFIFIEFENNDRINDAIDNDDIHGIVTYNVNDFNSYFETSMTVYQPCIICLSEHREDAKAFLSIAQNDQEYDEYMTHKLINNVVSTESSCCNTSSDVSDSNHSHNVHKKRTMRAQEQINSLKKRLEERKAKSNR